MIKSSVDEYTDLVFNFSVLFKVITFHFVF